MTASTAAAWPRAARERLPVLLELLLGLAAVYALMCALGWLVTAGPLGHGVLRGEDGIDRAFAQHRNPSLNSVSGFFSELANTPSAIMLSAVAFVAIRVLTHRWAEAVFVATALLSEVTVFLLTTVAIERPRPAVPRLDPHAPPTSSFPSGHTAAAVALYTAVALVLWRRGVPWPAWLLLAVPCAVGFSRMYRGMHHPSDVVAGAVLGGLSVLLAYRVVLRAPALTRRDRQ